MRTAVVKYAFTFTDEDRKLIEKLQARLKKAHGPVTKITALRYALRVAAAAKE